MLWAGWKTLADSWSVWLLLALVNLLFIWIQQQLWQPALARLLPRIPPLDSELVTTESYVVLAMEGTHTLLASPFFQRFVLAFLFIALLKWLLAPFLHIFIFSPLSQPEPTVSYYLLWRQLSHRFPAFLTVVTVQYLGFILATITLGLFGLSLAESIWRTGSKQALFFLLLLLLAGTVLFCWAFSTLTLWQAALARGERLWPAALGACRTLLQRPVLSVLLPLLFWLGSTALAALIHMGLPAVQIGVWLTGVLLPVPYLWLTYTLAASVPADRMANE